MPASRTPVGRAGLPPVDLPRAALDEGSLPLYEQVAGRLWEDLRVDGAGAGDRLPSERVLGERYGVSRVTMRSALGLLSERGAVSAAPSRGWYVAGDTEIASSASHIEGFADHAKRHRIRATTRMLMSRVRPCTVAEARRLRTRPGDDLFEMRRVRSLDGLVVVLEHNRLLLSLCPALAETDFTHASLYATLLTADPPQIPRRAEYAVGARPPTKPEREALELTGTGIPVLLARQITFSQHGHPLELTDQAYRSDRYQFRATIF